MRAVDRISTGVLEDEDKVSVAEVRQILLKRITDEESPVFARIWAETYSLLKG